MTKKQRASWIFKKWEASLAEKDKTLDSVSTNFDELFHELSILNIPFEEAQEYVDLAVSAHSPDTDIVKAVYRRKPDFVKKDTSFESFRDKWIKAIKDRAINSFSCFFDDNIVAPTQSGPMSTREYMAARKYAESFPVIDVTTLPELDVDELFDLGEIDD